GDCAIEIGDVECSIGERRMILPSHPEFQRELVADPEAVLAVDGVVPGKPVGIKTGLGKTGGVGNAEEEVGEIGIGKAAVELEAAIIILAEEVEIGLGAEAADVEA